jgi:hypothetical protein
MQPLHYWESIDYNPTLNEYPHGPHYLCTSCSTKKKSAVLPQKVRQIHASKPIESISTRKKSIKVMVVSRLPMETLVRDADGDIGNEATDVPILPSDAKVPDDDEGIDKQGQMTPFYQLTERCLTMITPFTN